MKVVVFSDVHGNYPNLLSFYESTLELGIDHYICLGDLCNYYPDNKAVIEFIQSKNWTCLLGNHDEFYLPGKAPDKEKKQAYRFDETLAVSEQHISFLKELPVKYEFAAAAKSVLCCHASPGDLLYTYIYPDTSLERYASQPYDIIFMGHTHRQFLRFQNEKIFCNVGSIGLPRDNGSLMGFAVLDTDSAEITLYRKEIDTTSIKKKYTGKVNQDVIELMDRKQPLNYTYTLLHGTN